MQISDEDYVLYKPLLFSLGYRMTGSVSETEDLIQETFLRAYQLPELEVENKKAYLCRMMTNRCIDFLRSAKVKREQYVGPWNPEPLLQSGDQRTDPSEILMEKEYLSIAYLRIMEHLTPHERAVLLLREAFGFSYSEISRMIEKTEDNCRKLFSRSKLKMAAAEGESLDYQKNLSLIQRFILAFQTERTEDLLELISENVTLYSDGGGKVKAAVRPILTRQRVLAFLQGITRNLSNEVQFTLTTVNGQPAMVNYMNGRIHSTISFSIFEDRIAEIYITMNPEKLGG
ncbi:RNA polymerase sigma-70 factor [Bacillus sp. NRRL B-14911]|uniref:RNA polymerase sigma factor n=1 Tax=Bacillus infantis NRRL B-14911 TaxID=1367477 RepID=U5L652_9BACI|nr:MULTISPECIES: RNA polymerase sigma-70 factor [Bacillus]AGX02833.1 RNA polymerase sigma factor [Bacillus infantis NRRL B-14911]EAR67141.1 RNA polymerase sigma-70 factor [Bacillus sp. NRRL B-14911]